LKADLGTSVVSVTLGEYDAVARAVELLAPLSEKPPLVENLIVELTVNDGPKAGADVLRALDGAEIPIAGLALREPSLDDVFLTLTGHKTTIEEGEQDAEEPVKPKRGFGRGRKSESTDGKAAAGRPPCTHLPGSSSPSRATSCRGPWRTSSPGRSATSSPSCGRPRPCSSPRCSRSCS